MVQPADKRFITFNFIADLAVGLQQLWSSSKVKDYVDTSVAAITKATLGLGSVDNIAAVNLRDRATHTGTQTSTTISDFTEAAQDAINALLVGASGVTLSYNDSANTLTITGGGAAGLDAEAVRDAIGVALVGTGNITVTVNDAADTITISTVATVNSTDAALRDRTSHTGQQGHGTVSDWDTAVLASAASQLVAGGMQLGVFCPSTAASRPTVPTGSQLVVVGGSSAVSWLTPGDLQLMTP